ncbi:hypothetical protein AAC387_Pa05g2568 [Persea americana]
MQLRREHGVEASERDVCHPKPTRRPIARKRRAKREKGATKRSPAQHYAEAPAQRKQQNTTLAAQKKPLGCKALHLIAALPAQGINQKTEMAPLSSEANPGPETKKDTTAQRRHHNHYLEKAPLHSTLLSLTQLSTSQPHGTQHFTASHNTALLSLTVQQNTRPPPLQITAQHQFTLKQRPSSSRSRRQTPLILKLPCTETNYPSQTIL